MSLKTTITKSTDGCLEQALRLSEAISGADAIVIGAGAGMSVSAGFSYSGARFEKYFFDFIRKYGFKDMYSAGFYPFAAPEEFWAYWSRYVSINRYMDAPVPVYEMLYRLVGEKDYFVLTTNVDHCFQKAGFDKQRLFYTQGDYGLFQCSLPCCQKTYDNEEAIRRMVEAQSDMRIPSELIPTCPVCGRPASMNLRIDDTFVEDEGWRRASERYAGFLQRHRHARVLFLELGTGYNTPGIIKYPFWQMTSQWADASYVCVNLGDVAVPEEIRERSICINGDIGDVFQYILNRSGSCLK